MKIIVKTLTGKTIMLEGLNAKDTLDTLKEKIQNQEGIPLDQQRLIFSGTKLVAGYPLEFYSILDNAILHLVVRGNISNFSAYDESDPLIQYLMKGDVVGLDASKDLLKEKRKDCNGSEKSEIVLKYTDETILNEEQRSRLIGLADYIHSLQKIEGKSKIVLQDIKIVLPNDILKEISQSDEVEKILRSHHYSPFADGKSNFVLRRTSSTLGCLPWHVDGLYSSCVVQYTLNDDKCFTGGRLCFFTDDMGLYVPQRPAGTLSVHKKELHAVSKLLTGVRYVLFVVEATNGLGEATENIVEFNQKMLEKMNSVINLLSAVPQDKML